MASRSRGQGVLFAGWLASFKFPRQVHFVEQFPMTGSGKIQKYLLREEARRLAEIPGSPSELPGLGSGDHEAEPLVAGVAARPDRRRA